MSQDSNTTIHQHQKLKSHSITILRPCKEVMLSPSVFPATHVTDIFSATQLSKKIQLQRISDSKQAVPYAVTLFHCRLLAAKNTIM
jgi:hypothetical protein